MTTQTVEYRSCVRLNCGACPPLAVILCLAEGLVAPKLCPGIGDDPELEQSFTYSTIEAVLDTEVCTAAYGCNAAYWTYFFTFDDAQLISGMILTSSGITGVICDNCFTDWAEQLAGDEVHIVTDEESGMQTLVSQHGCEYPINAEAGCPMAVTDTATVDLTIDDASCQTLSADVKISADVGNTTVAHADGIFTPAGGGGGLITSVEDTSCIDLEVVDGVLTAIPIISADGGNCLQCIDPGEGEGGLFVACPTPADFNVLQAYGSSTTPLSALYTVYHVPILNQSSVPFLVYSNRARFKVWGTFAANANAKRIFVFLSATLLFDTTALAFNNSSFLIEGEILATTDVTQRTVVKFSSSDALMPITVSVLDTAVDLTVLDYIDIRVTTLAANDMLFKTFEFDWIRDP